MNHDPVEDLLKKVAFLQPASTLRNRVLAGACEKAVERARTRYNAMLKAACTTLLVVVITGAVLDRAASRRLNRMIYAPVAAREVDAAARELARELADTLDGDDRARIEEYFARALSSSSAGSSRIGPGQDRSQQEKDVWMRYLMEGQNQWTNQPG